jgi:hypothetical protein
MRVMLRVCSAVLILLTIGCFSATSTKAQVSASPSAVNFGSVNVNSLSSPTVIVLTNTGTSVLFLQKVTSSLSQFIVAGPSMPLTLQSQESISFQVIFQPTAASSLAGSIMFTMVRGSAGTILVPVSGTGVALPTPPTPTYLLSASSSSLSFGNALVGSASSQAIMLTNTGNSSVNISQLGASGPGFSVSGMTAPAVLASGQSVSLLGRFSPTTAGSSTGSITVVSSATNSPTTTILLSGTGTQPQLSVVPTSVAFGNLTVGSTNTQTVTLRNPGTANLVITQATIVGGNFAASGLSLPFTLAAGGSTAFTASFTPTVAGSIAGSMSLVSNAPNSPLVVSLSGSGTAQVRTLSANPISLSFGSLALNTSATHSVSLTNTGNFAVTISQLNITGTGFSKSGISLPLTLAAGQSTSFNAIFDPATASSLNGSATVVSSATNSPLTIALSGSGAAPVVHSISLAWGASTSSVVGYNVYSSSQFGGPYTKVNSSPSAALTYSDTNVVSGQSYYFVITAENSSGVESAYSNQATALIP